jgi:type IX secretion system PorP/SprF family membrane protein
LPANIPNIVTMCKRIIILLAAITAFAVARVDAQDAMFSQFYANPLYLNPAMAGTNVCPRVALNFRDQWPKLKGNYITYTGSFDEHFDKIAGGVGIIIMHDHAGANGGYINTSSISPMYSFKAQISKKFALRLALQLDIQDKYLNWDNLVFGDQIDSRYGYVYQTQETRPGSLHRWTAGLSAGLLGYTPHVYFGMAVHHITTFALDGQNTSYLTESYADMYDMMPVKWTAHVGANFDVKRKSKRETSFGDISLSPNFVYQHQRYLNYFNLGLYANFYPFTVGVWYRFVPSYKVKDSTNAVVGKINNSDALVFMAGLEYKLVKFGISYDITLGQLKNDTGGAIEASLQFLLPCPEKHKAIKDLKCPSF